MFNQCEKRVVDPEALFWQCCAQSLLKLDSVFINLNFPKPRGAFADSGKHNSQKVLENMNSDTLVKG